MATAKLQDQTEQVDLASTTMLLVANFSKLGNTRQLKKDQYNHAGDEDMVKAQKKLLVSPELRAIGRLDAELREYFKDECLPFPQPSTYMIPNSKVEEVEREIKKFMRKRDKRVDKFVAVYEEAREQAKKKLGPLYNPRNYPAVDQVKYEFGFWYCFTYFGVPEKLKEIKASIFTEEREKQKALMVSAVEEIRDMRREVMLKLVQHLANKLGEENGKSKIFRNTTVKNLQDWLDKFGGLNVDNDVEAEALVKNARKLLAGVSPEELRTTEGVRDRVKKGMEKIAAELTTLVEDRPSRKMRGF